ncbi:hypothetical protein PUR71_01360 [Streptomyces sp. SP17BM10]|uniref:hypothetical protein n=1 Tax=Streptomyces sp. SP17BM10 TaxID=3002530 RepID=UPI002E75A553|nr:hypothetical protein [Streptomyces sp. SP17BM10]MEE1781588.1 hypothetical protein [Streptomyces sp. SP17BM10]
MVSDVIDRNGRFQEGPEPSTAGEHIRTSCTALGLERWITVLTDHFHGDLDHATETVRTVRKEPA